MSICFFTLIWNRDLIPPLHHSSTSPKNIRLIKEDLESKSMTGILPFLKALLARMLLEQKGNVLGKDPEFHRQLITERDEIFEEMLGAAVSFCNKKEGDNWEKMKEGLKD